MRRTSEAGPATPRSCRQEGRIIGKAMACRVLVIAGGAFVAGGDVG
jgi:hypothetical protein